MEVRFTRQARIYQQRERSFSFDRRRKSVCRNDESQFDTISIYVVTSSQNANMNSETTNTIGIPRPILLHFRGNNAERILLCVCFLQLNTQNIWQYMTYGNCQSNIKIFLSKIRCYSSKIYLWQQNRWSAFHSIKISFLRSFFWRLRVDKSHWEPNLVCTVSTHLILSVISVFCATSTRSITLVKEQYILLRVGWFLSDFLP